MRDGVDRQRYPVLNTNFTHQFRDVRFNRALFNSQRGTNFLIGTPRHQQFQNLFFAVGESYPSGRENPSRRRRDPLNEG